MSGQRMASEREMTKLDTYSGTTKGLLRINRQKPVELKKCKYFFNYIQQNNRVLGEQMLTRIWKP